MISAVGLLALGACGGDDGGSGGSGGSGTIPPGSLEVDALDIRFDMDQYEATAGEVTIAYVSKGAQTHTLVLFDADNRVIDPKLEVTPGSTDVGTYDLAAGSYQMVCDVPGHREAGMVATLGVS
jgi:plastocyanin